MDATFVEMQLFTRHRHDYLDDKAFADLQQALLLQPDIGDVIANTGGLRKVRFGDALRGKGKRGGLRVIYYWRQSDSQFWLFALYDKDQLDDLSYDQRKLLKNLLDIELKARKRP
ncbi:toxin [Pseudomonas sp. GV071]|uniref:toxin n=1 Tax=Pseudomonas sp. GV071 TaxID=2135754 RepID=UPI000D3933D8|nr:toxin [Pseudomonas sp. GV071]PTQ71489.1 hypothetical protein C8K61_10436 [Pseudomonas sp. GV071]